MSAKFFNAPIPKEGPNDPFKLDTIRNPVLRGLPLAIGSYLISSSTTLQSFFWNNAGFEKLFAGEARDYSPCYDPTVIPISDPASTSALPEFPPPRKRANGVGYLTSADYHELYTSGKLTPVAVIEALLPLVRRDTSPPGAHSVAFSDTKVQLVQAAAAASTKRYKQGISLGPLDGVPVAVKDQVELEGYKNTMGSKLDFTDNGQGTSWCVKKWEEAGAIIIGKTTMHELGMDVTNNNPHYGTPRNPQNKNYYTGGSSGGSAYCVGAGLTPICLGADGGGSIRIPAAFCGVWGLKPSHGRVSSLPGMDLASSNNVCGPIASNLDDLALAYRIMAAPDSSHASSSMFPPSIPPSPSAPKVLGIYKEWFDSADPAVAKKCREAVDQYSKFGYEVVDITIPFLLQTQKAHALTILTEIASGIAPDQVSKLTLPNKILISVPGSQARARDFMAAQKLRNVLVRHLAFLWKKHPGMMIVTPTMPVAGWKINMPHELDRGLSDTDLTSKTMRYVWVANFSGCPAITCPVGYTAGDGGDLPVGLMAMGEWGSEEQLLQFGKDGEGILGKSGARKPNENWVDVLELAAKKAEAT